MDCYNSQCLRREFSALALERFQAEEVEEVEEVDFLLVVVWVVAAGLEMVAAASEL